MKVWKFEKFIENANKYSAKIIIYRHEARFLSTHFEFYCFLVAHTSKRQRQKMSFNCKRRKLDEQNNVGQDANAREKVDDADDVDTAELKHSKSLLERNILSDSHPTAPTPATVDESEVNSTEPTLLVSAQINQNGEIGELVEAEVEEKKELERAAVDDDPVDDREEGKEEKKLMRAAVDEDPVDDDEDEEEVGDDEDQEGDEASDEDGSHSETDQDDQDDKEKEKMMEKWTNEECEQWNDEPNHERLNMLELRNEWRQKDWRDSQRGWKTTVANWKPAAVDSYESSSPDPRQTFEKALEGERLTIRDNYLRKMRDLTMRFHEEQEEMMLKEYRRLFTSTLKIPTNEISSESAGGKTTGIVRWKKEWAESMNSWLQDDVKLSVIFSKNPLTASAKEQVTVELSSWCALVFLRREAIPVACRHEDEFSKLVTQDEEGDADDDEKYEDALDSYVFQEKLRNRAMGSISFVEMKESIYYRDTISIPSEARGGQEKWLCFVKNPRETSCTWTSFKLLRLTSNTQLTKYLYAIYSTLTSVHSVPFNLWASKILEIMSYFHVHLPPATNFDHNGHQYSVSDGKFFQPPICENSTAENYHFFPFHSFPSRVLSKLTNVDSLATGSTDDSLSLSSSSSSSSSSLSIVEITEDLQPTEVEVEDDEEKVETKDEKVKMGTWINLRCLPTLSVEADDSQSWNTMSKWIILDTMDRYFVGCFDSSLVSPSSTLFEQWTTFCKQMNFTHSHRHHDNGALHWKFHQDTIPNASNAPGALAVTGRYIELEITAAAQAWIPYKRLDRWLSLSVRNGLSDVTLPRNQFSDAAESMETFSEHWKQLQQHCVGSGMPIPLSNIFFEEQNYASVFAFYTWFAMLSGEIMELIEQVREKVLTTAKATYPKGSHGNKWINDSTNRDISLLLKTKTTLGRTLAHLEETAVVLDPLLCAPLVKIVADYLKVGGAPIPYLAEDRLGQSFQ